MVRAIACGPAIVYFFIDIYYFTRRGLTVRWHRVLLYGANAASDIVLHQDFIFKIVPSNIKIIPSMKRLYTTYLNIKSDHECRRTSIRTMPTMRTQSSTSDSDSIVALNRTNSPLSCPILGRDIYVRLIRKFTSY